jgi:tRNA G18 (ribose-2'-O)-methylase SpoU
VSKEVLDESDVIIELPMYGVNISLNVWGTAAIVTYKVLESLR